MEIIRQFKTILITKDYCQLNNGLHAHSTTMKNTWLITLAILSSCLYSCTETELNEPEKNQLYYKVVGSYHDDHLLSSRIVKDNELLITGYTVDQFMDERLFVSKLGNDGMLQWASHSKNLINSRFFDGLQMSGKQLYACFGCQYKEGDQVKMFLSYLDDTGNYVDSLNFNITASSINGAQLIEETDDNLLLLVQYINQNNNYISTYRVSASNELRLISKQLIPMDFHQAIKVSAKHNGAHYLVSSASQASGVRKAWLAKVKNGFLEWWNVTDYNGQWLTGNDVTISNNKIIVLSNIYSKTETQKGALLTKVSASGQVLSQQECDLGYDKNKGYAVSIDTDNKGNFIFVSNVSTDLEGTNNSQDITYSLTNYKGELVLSNSYGSHGTHSDNGNSAWQINFLPNKNESLIVGHIDLLNNIDICTIKVNKKGQWIVQ